LKIYSYKALTCKDIIVKESNLEKCCILEKYDVKIYTRNIILTPEYKKLSTKNE
jgi:hypothetical protein